MTDDMCDLVHDRTSWFGYAAASWAFTFGCLHLAWATGWYIGLEKQQAQSAFAHPWFLVYDLVVAGMCALGVGVATALVRPWGLRLPRRAVGGIAAAGTALLALRGGAAVAQAISLAARNEFVLRPMHLWDAWFCLGALLFALATWKYWTRALREAGCHCDRHGVAAQEPTTTE